MATRQQTRSPRAARLFDHFDQPTICALPLVHVSDLLAVTALRRTATRQQLAARESPASSISQQLRAPARSRQRFARGDSAASHGNTATNSRPARSPATAATRSPRVARLFDHFDQPTIARSCSFTSATLLAVTALRRVALRLIAVQLARKRVTLVPRRACQYLEMGPVSPEGKQSRGLGSGQRSLVSWPCGHGVQQHITYNPTSATARCTCAAPATSVNLPWAWSHACSGESE